MRFRTSIFARVLAIISALIVSQATRAAETEDQPLRWKLNVGEKLDYAMVQEMELTAGEGASTGKMRQEMQMTWEVLGVDEKTGEVVVKQKFDRLKMKLTAPIVGFDYDSKSDEPPTGYAAIIAPLFKTMTQTEFEVTMSARGEIKDVKFPEEVIEALKASPGAAQMGEMATREGFKKMLSQGALVLPEKAPKKGDTWTTRVEMSNPNAGGNQIVETVYHYDGRTEIDGRPYAVIKPELTMSFEGTDGRMPLMKVVEQKSSGEILFNIEQGRLASTSLKQNVAIEATGADGQSAIQKIDQTIDLKVTSAEDKKADAAEAKPESGEAKDKSEG